MGRRKKYHKKKKASARRKRIRGRNHLYRGYRMASKAETIFAKECDARNLDWIYEPDTFDWVPPVATYKPDFKIIRKDGTHFYVEYKGFLRNPEKRKMIEMKRQHPALDVRFVFEKANKPVPGAKPRKDGSKMTHAEWAEKYGYKWSEGFINPKWLKGEK